MNTNTVNVEGPYCDISDKPELGMVVRVRTSSILTDNNTVDIGGGIQCNLFECPSEVREKFKFCTYFYDDSNGTSLGQYQKTKKPGIFEATRNIWGCKIGKIGDYEIVVDIFVSGFKCFIKPTSPVVIWPAIQKWIENNIVQQEAVEIVSFQEPLTIYD